MYSLPRPSLLTAYDTFTLAVAHLFDRRTGGGSLWPTRPEPPPVDHVRQLAAGGVPAWRFKYVLVWLTGQLNGAPLTASVPWLPTLGLSVSLYFDSFSALFALLVAGIGVLVIVYGGYYLKSDPTAWRFQFYMLLFMTAMLGVVMAGDVVALFVFWELTSITSFLIIAYKTKDEAARRGAFRALFITGGGGIAMLAGLLFMSTVAGSTEYTTILDSRAALTQYQYYPVILVLIAFGAFTKSAQFPAHIWLPGAMSAPYSGQRLSPLRDDGQRRHLLDGASASGVGRHGVVVLAAGYFRPADDAHRRLCGRKAK